MDFSSPSEITAKPFSLLLFFFFLRARIFPASGVTDCFAAIQMSPLCRDWRVKRACGKNAMFAARLIEINYYYRKLWHMNSLVAPVARNACIEIRQVHSRRPLCRFQLNSKDNFIHVPSRRRDYLLDFFSHCIFEHYARKRDSLWVYLLFNAILLSQSIVNGEIYQLRSFRWYIIADGVIIETIGFSPKNIVSSHNRSSKHRTHWLDSIDLSPFGLKFSLHECYCGRCWCR